MSLLIHHASGVIEPDALYADVLLASPLARLVLTRDCWGGIVWRIGARTYALHLSGLTELDAAAAYDWGIIDAITDDADAWLGARSLLALESGASLIARRGGDPLERAEFARLFAIGEPQEGLRAFLEKRRATWGQT
jgi:enoyl-CoA hydratase/carnithine racemase